MTVTRLFWSWAPTNTLCLSVWQSAFICVFAGVSVGKFPVRGQVWLIYQDTELSIGTYPIETLYLPAASQLIHLWLS